MTVNRRLGEAQVVRLASDRQRGVLNAFIRQINMGLALPGRIMQRGHGLPAGTEVVMMSMQRSTGLIDHQHPANQPRTAQQQSRALPSNGITEWRS